MFKASIISTPFVTNDAECFFGNKIRGASFNGDKSFLSTLRALITPRINADDRLYLYFGSSSHTASQIDDAPAGLVTKAICSDYYLLSSDQRIIIHSFCSNQANNARNFQMLDRDFLSAYSEYHELEKIREFYRKSFELRCYISPKRKNVIVFVDRLDNRKLHYLQASTLALLPWYFNPADGVTEDEMALILSLRESDPEKYEQCLAKIAGQYDFRGARIRQMLSGFETRFEKEEIIRVRREIEDCGRDINRINREIGSILSHRHEMSIRLLGLEQKIADGGDESEIMDYFLCNSHLVLEDTNGCEIKFSVKDYLEYFDREIAEKTINNMNSFVYTNRRNEHSREDNERTKKLLTEIFVSETPRLRIRSCAAYYFDLNGNVNADEYHDFGAEFSDYLPNTHINRYRCMGNYTTVINQMLADRDYIGAIEQCAASCKSLNWGDVIVMEEFMSAMWEDEDNVRCIELPDGSVVKPSEAIQWLEEQDTPRAVESTDGNSTTTEEAKDE